MMLNFSLPNQFPKQMIITSHNKFEDSDVTTKLKLNNDAVTSIGAKQYRKGFLIDRAQIYEQLGHFDKALEYYEEAAVYCTRINNPENRIPAAQVSSLLNSVGNIYLQMGNSSEAMEAFVKAMRINHLAGILSIEDLITQEMTLENEIDVCDVIKSYSQNAAAA